jgi:hypothetical protein
MAGTSPAMTQRQKPRFHVMPAHSASEDARERAYVAGIHVLLA